LCRNSGVHAAGVIIADQPLDDVIPLCRDKEGNDLTQFEGPIAEKCGLLKMDFLGLRTLSVLTRSVELARQSGALSASFDIEKIDLTDRSTLDLFCRGETKGIFQFESGGMQELLLRMKPDRLEDLIAANALFRPGPIELIPNYCARKHGTEEVPRVHPIMDGILSETYGIMTYQEDVMKIFNQLGGIELSSAYKLIKAISKKTTDVIAKFRPDFVKGCSANGVDADRANDIFELILKFGGYGFNKSHSTRYAIVAFQTAYMKTYHPVEYMAALLTYEIGSNDKMVEYIGECQRMKLKVLPPDVNSSERDFTPIRVDAAKKGRAKAEKESVIRFGLGAVRGVGDKAVEAIVEARRKGGAFKSLFDFCERVDLKSVQKSTMDALIRAGAFVTMHPERAPLLHVLDKAFEMAQQASDDRASGQFSLFGAPQQGSTAQAVKDPPLPKVPEYSPAELLAMEKELLGFYISSHPLTQNQLAIEAFSVDTVHDAMGKTEGAEVLIGGMVGSVKARVAKTGQSAGKKWAIVEIEDLTGKIEGMCFSETYANLEARDSTLLKSDRVVIVKAKVDRKRETPCLIINDIIGVEEAAGVYTQTIVVRPQEEHLKPESIDQLAAAIKSSSGGIEVFVVAPVLVEGKAQKVTMKLGKKFGARPTKKLVEEIEHAMGLGSVEFIGPGTRLRKLRRQQAEQMKKEQLMFKDAAVEEHEMIVAEPMQQETEIE